MGVRRSRKVLGLENVVSRHGLVIVRCRLGIPFGCLVSVQHFLEEKTWWSQLRMNYGSISWRFRVVSSNLHQHLNSPLSVHTFWICDTGRWTYHSEVGHMKRCVFGTIDSSLLVWCISCKLAIAVSLRRYAYFDMTCIANFSWRSTTQHGSCFRISSWMHRTASWTISCQQHYSWSQEKCVILVLQW